MINPKVEVSSSNVDLVASLLGEMQNKLTPNQEFKKYRFRPWDYVEEYFGWTPWEGNGLEEPGQKEIMEAYVEVIRLQIQRRELEAKLKQHFDKYGVADPELAKELHNLPAPKRWLRIEAGHTIGKTKLAAGLVSHFFDCFNPSIVYAFAPTYDQINDLLFKEIRTDRAKVPAMVQPKKTPDITTEQGNHFVKGKAIGRGSTETVQGQHNDFQLFIMDEAEGIPGFVYDAVRSMLGGGIGLVIMIANPKTDNSTFAKMRDDVEVQNFRISCLNHPNVVNGFEVVPNAISRSYVDSMIEIHTEEVTSHDNDYFTFTVPWRPGKIFLPDNEFLFRVLGVAPRSAAVNTFCPVGRFEAALKRKSPEGVNLEKGQARVGIDVARYGDDVGTIYVHTPGKITRKARIAQKDGFYYYARVLEVIEELKEQGYDDVHVRVDGGGGYGSTVIDNLNANIELQEGFKDFRVWEVHNNAVAPGEESGACYDMVTAMYKHAGEVVQSLVLEGATPQLQTDLTDRRYVYSMKKGVEVKRLESKEKFRSRVKRSPDDGDGFVLALAPDRFFVPVVDLGYA